MGVTAGDGEGAGDAEGEAEALLDGGGLGRLRPALRTGEVAARARFSGAAGDDSVFGVGEVGVAGEGEALLIIKIEGWW